MLYGDGELSNTAELFKNLHAVTICKKLEVYSHVNPPDHPGAC